MQVDASLHEAVSYTSEKQVAHARPRASASRAPGQSLREVYSRPDRAKDRRLRRLASALARIDRAGAKRARGATGQRGSALGGVLVGRLGDWAMAVFSSRAARMSSLALLFCACLVQTQEPKQSSGRMLFPPHKASLLKRWLVEGAARNRRVRGRAQAADVGFRRRIWAAWFGHPMAGSRKAVFQALNRSTGVPVTLVTQANLQSFVLPDHPLHPAFEHLSAVHKSDYLAAYLLHHYGGGWHDIKRPHGSWRGHFDKFQNDSLWLLGPREVQPGHVACNDMVASLDAACLELRKPLNESADYFMPIADEPPTSYVNGQLDPWLVSKGVCCERIRRDHSVLVGVQAFIARPGTPFTEEWLTTNHRRLDAKLEALKKYPAPFPRCCFNHESGYPLGWNDLKGGAFHPLCHKHRAHVDTSMPRNPAMPYRDPRSEDSTER